MKDRLCRLIKVAAFEFDDAENQTCNNIAQLETSQIKQTWDNFSAFILVAIFMHYY